MVLAIQNHYQIPQFWSQSAAQGEVRVIMHCYVILTLPFISGVWTISMQEVHSWSRTLSKLNMRMAARCVCVCVYV